MPSVSRVHLPSRRALRQPPAWPRSSQAEIDCFDIVAVGIKQKGRVISRAVIDAQPGLSVVLTAGFDSVLVEAVDRRPVLRFKSDVTAAGRLGRSIKPKGRCAFRA